MRCTPSRVSRRFFVGLLFAVATSFWCGTAQSWDDTKVPPAGVRVFYTGHSFHMFVAPGVEQLVKSAGIQGHKLVGTQGIGGSRVIQHWELDDTKNKAKPALTTGEVDVFTMAPILAIPDEGVEKFTELALKHNPNVRLLVQASWIPYDITGPALDKRIRDNAERDNTKVEEIRESTDLWRKKMETQVDDLNKRHGRTALYIVPVGNAVIVLREMVVADKFPGVKKQSELYIDPIGHGKGQIRALTTYCNYVAIYRRSPEGLTLNEMGVDPEQHAILQKIAWETVSKYPYSGVKKL